MRAPHILALILSLAAPVFADNQDSKHAATLEELLQKISRALPDGWTAKLAPSASDPFGEPQGVGAPTLVIHTRDPVKTFRQYAGSPDGKPHVQRELVQIRYEARRYVTPLEHVEGAKKNNEAKRQRIAFAATRIKDVAVSSGKSNPPYPPDTYKPNGPAEQRAVLEYAYLWMRTMPEELPSHHFRGLAFERYDNTWMTRIDDAQIAGEHRKIDDLLDKILKPYKEGPNKAQK